MTYAVILRKRNEKYIARVREWPEIVIEEDSREDAIAHIKTDLSAYLSQPPEVIQIDVESGTVAEHPWLQFAGMWADDPTWQDFLDEVEASRKEIDRLETEA